MFTTDDFRKLEKLFDTKLKSLKTDVAAIETRISDLEIGRVTKLDFMEVRSLLNKVEKRMAAYDSRLSKIESLLSANKADLKKDLLTMEKRLMKSINRLADTVDDRLLEVEDRVDKLNQHMDHPPIATT